MKLNNVVRYRGYNVGKEIFSHLLLTDVCQCSMIQ